MNQQALMDIGADTLQINRVVKLMGNRFEFTAICENPEEGERAIDAAIQEVQRIEALLSTYRTDSQTNLINAHAGLRPVQVEREMIHLIERSKKISRLTQGAFDISYGSIDKSLWNFDVHMSALPDRETAARSIRLINYKNVVVNSSENTVMLLEKGMRIGFGGIGKGYAADQAKKVMQQAGIKSGVINAAGDLISWGRRENGQQWTVGIADPEHRNRVFSALQISDLAIATSGDYEKYAIIDGKRYSHTIDPKTGLPVSGIKSVSIICPSAELADALSTPVMVMGVKLGLDMINQMANMACVIIDDHHQVFTSANIHLKN